MDRLDFVTDVHEKEENGRDEHYENAQKQELLRPAYLAVRTAVLRVIPERSRRTVLAYLSENNEDGGLEELRFRVGKPIQLRMRGRERMLYELPVFSQTDARMMLEAVCGGSVYAHEAELVNGYVTLPGGVRVGLSGKPLLSGGAVVRFTTVSGFDIRLPRQRIGCAEKHMKLLTDERGYPRSALIASPPGEGKTTFLRDCIRCFSMGIGVARPLNVAVADERNELTGSINGVPTLDVGPRTDIMEGVPKAIAIPMLIRSMAPDVIVTDELMGENDAEAAALAVSCGTAVLASVHAGSAAELFAKTDLLNALKPGALSRLFILKRDGSILSLEPAADPSEMRMTCRN